MTTQEEVENEGLAGLLRLAIDLLEKPDHQNINLEMAQNLIRQAFFKYLDLADCPFRETCNEAFREEYEPEAPYGRDDVD